LYAEDSYVWFQKRSFDSFAFERQSTRKVKVGSRMLDGDPLFWRIKAFYSSNEDKEGNVVSAEVGAPERFAAILTNDTKNIRSP
jgi:hypothetical protein